MKAFRILIITAHRLCIRTVLQCMHLCIYIVYVQGVVFNIHYIRLRILKQWLKQIKMFSVLIHIVTYSEWEFSLKNVIQQEIKIDCTEQQTTKLVKHYMNMTYGQTTGMSQTVKVNSVSISPPLLKVSFKFIFLMVSSLNVKIWSELNTAAMSQFVERSSRMQKIKVRVLVATVQRN